MYDAPAIVERPPLVGYLGIRYGSW